MNKHPLRSFARSFSLKPNFSKLKLIDQPPGHIVGDVNDPVPTIDPDHYHGSYHWTYERLVAITMVPLSITPFVSSTPYPILDAILSTLILVHANAGFQSCIIDYIPKRVYGVWHKLAMGLLTMGTCVGLYGIYEIETKDEGLTTLVKKLWTEPEPKPLSYF
jgi:succinate dehydrogenase hydrophobic anchor subunit